MCGRFFRRLYLLKRHVRVHPRKGPYSCSLCNESFSKSSDLALHRFAHETSADRHAPDEEQVAEDPNAINDIENEQEDELLGLEGHMRVRNLSPLQSSSAKPQYTLPQPSFPIVQSSAPAGPLTSLPQEYDLVSKRLPRTSKGYACKQPACKKRFDTRAQMNKHYRSHIPDNQRNFKCSNCRKGFNDARDLKRHVEGKNGCKATNSGDEPSHHLFTPVPESTATPREPWNRQHKASDDHYKVQLPRSPVDERIDECIQILGQQRYLMHDIRSIVSWRSTTVFPTTRTPGGLIGQNVGESQYIYIPNEEPVRNWRCRNMH